MSNWTSGYITDIEYTHGYYRELSPPLLALATLSRGVSTHAGKPLRYLELGFGQGLSLAIHAAACNGEFWGTDFNPAQAANARALLAAAGVNAHVFDQSFAEFAARTDLPEFDIIGVHGIWSWISDENRAVIVDIVRRKLALGGMLYLSFNCTPGWSPAMPLRHLMSIHSEMAGSDGQGFGSRVEGALDFAQQVVDSGALYFRANPAVAERLKKLKQEKRNYLAHEFFNQHWAPMPFSQVAEMLEAAKVSFAASAHLFDHVDAINLSAQGQALLAGISHPILRESVRDYLVAAQFRKDVFVKGGRAMAPLEQRERFSRQAFLLSTLPEDVPLTIQGAAGAAVLQEDLYRPLLAILAENLHAPKALQEIANHPAMAGRSSAQLIEALLILTATGHVHPTQAPETIALAAPRCKALNTHIFNRARYNNEIGFLASPVIGAGISVNRFEQLFLLARQDGQPQPEAWAEFAWSVLLPSGQRLLKDGKVMEDAGDNIAELLSQAKSFAAKRLPVMQALRVA